MRLESTALPQDLTDPVPVLVLGVAPAGPADRVLPYGEWWKYGLAIQEEVSVDAIVTSATLQLPPSLDSLSLRFHPHDGKPSFLVQKTGVTGRVVSFRSAGTSGTLVITYKPTTSGAGDMVLAEDIASRMTVPVYGLRASGVAATGALGGWVFQSVYPGALYNGIKISGSSTGFTVSSSVWGSVTIEHGGSVEQLLEALRKTKLSGRLLIEATQWDNTVPTGLVTLTGGMSFAITDSLFRYMLEFVDHGRSFVIVPAFPVTQSMVQSFIDFNRSRDYRFFLVANPSESVNVSDSHVVLVTGTCYTTDGRQAPACLAVAESFCAPYSSMYSRIPAEPFPAASATVLTQQGRVGIIRVPGYPLRISNTISTDGKDHRFTFWLTQLLIRAYSSAIGKSSIPSNLDVELSALIRSLPYVRDVSIRSALDRRSGILLVQVDVTIADRVLHITVPLSIGGRG